MRRAAIVTWMVLAAGCASTVEAPAPSASTADTDATVPTSATTTPSTAATPTIPASSGATSLPLDAITPSGFATIRAVVTEPDGTTCDVCLWLADTPPLRARGLMTVTDLGGPVGMAFRYPGPHTGTFWMKDTVLPLSIAFFAPDGAFLDAFDMEPCERTPCPNYATPEDFLVAVEVPQGELAEHGMVPGSRLDLGDLPCE